MRKWVVCVVLGLATLAAFNAVSVHAMEKGFDLDSFMEEKIGTDTKGYYTFCFDKISECFEVMDEALTNATGRESGLGDLWNECVTEGIERFAGMDEEAALDEFEKVLNEVE